MSAYKNGTRSRQKIASGGISADVTIISATWRGVCDLSRSRRTQKRLVIHRNTLTYRLQKVALLTGLDLRRFDDATQIHLALLLRSFGRPASRRNDD